MATIRDAECIHQELLVKKHKKVVRETLEFSDGGKEEWVYIDTPKSVMIVAITPAKELVVVKLYRHNLKRDVVELPAGIVEAHENEDVLQAAGRELREETGYASSQVVDLGSYYALPSETNRWIHYYLALDALKVEAPKLDDIIEKYFEMSYKTVAFDDVCTFQGAAARGIVGVESLVGIKLAQEYLAAH